MASALTLPEDRRSQLDDIVGRMQANNEPDENIQWVVDDFKNKYGAPGPAAPPSPIKYIGPHDQPQEQPPLGFRPNEGYTPISKMGQNILPLVMMGAAAAPELGSAGGSVARITGGGIKGGLEAIPTAKATAPATAGALIGDLIAGPKGAAVGAGIGAAPEVLGGVVRGAKAAMPPRPLPPPPVRSPGWMAGPGPQPRPMPEVQPITPIPSLRGQQTSIDLQAPARTPVWQGSKPLGSRELPEIQPIAPPPRAPKAQPPAQPAAEAGVTLPPEHQAIADEIVKESRFTTLPKPDFMAHVKDALQARGAAHFTPEELQSIYDHIDSRVVARKH